METMTARTEIFKKICEANPPICSASSAAYSSLLRKPLPQPVRLISDFFPGSQVKPVDVFNLEGHALILSQERLMP